MKKLKCGLNIFFSLKATLFSISLSLYVQYKVHTAKYTVYTFTNPLLAPASSPSAAPTYPQYPWHCTYCSEHCTVHNVHVYKPSASSSQQSLSSSHLSTMSSALSSFFSMSSSLRLTSMLSHQVFSAASLFLMSVRLTSTSSSSPLSSTSLM